MTADDKIYTVENCETMEKAKEYTIFPTGGSITWYINICNAKCMLIEVAQGHIVVNWTVVVIVLEENLWDYIGYK